MPASRIIRAAAGAASTLLLLVVVASPALASTATSVSGSISFSGSGSTMKAVTSVKFTSTYAGSYNVKYDVYRSTSSSRTSPTKVNTKTVFTKTLTTAKGKAYTYGPNSSNCAAGTTTYYYWIQGTVADTTGGTATFTSGVVSAKGCTAL
ncbi:MAG: hypothetical protein AB7O74_09480 [Candidatus Nanopelagicales bacterium]